MRRALVAGLFALVAAIAGPATPARAHVAERAEWSERYAELTQLFPDADPERWRSVEYRVSRKEARELERRLGFALEPEDLVPLFFIAHDDDGQLLGVAMFIEPHAGDYAHASFEVGVAVDPEGHIAALAVAEDREAGEGEHALVQGAAREALAFMKVALGA